ncbi:type II secretion system F family protein [Aeoliella sp. ICT_H6.2]|uniref:Type II secretion system F family protein n=1 Tax=Aeoliella straminimaris TaxID=2954799 RepID=A0A9X2JHV4_9BACT|nr:type II secretion system F family protein [Aeoliella straminimaris]
MVFLAPLLVLMVGLAMRMALSMAYGARGPEPNDYIYLLLLLLSWIFLAVGIFAWCMLPLAGSPGALMVCVLLWTLGGFALVDGVTTSRDANRRTNAKLLSIAQREGQLKETSVLFEGLRQGRYVGRAARRLSRELQAGTPLYESVRTQPAALPRASASYAAVGTLAKAEPQALDELSRPEDPVLASASRSCVDYVAYLVAISLTMGLLLSLYGVFIVPQFREIFWEFDLELPPATQLLIDGFAFTPMSILMTIAAVLTLVMLMLIGIFYLCDMRVLRLMGDWLFRRAHVAKLLRMVALGIEHRVEFERLLYALSVTYPVRSLRSRLSGAYTEAHNGQSLPAALMAHQLLTSSEAGLIETAERVGNVPWALRQIALRRENLLAARMNVVVRIAYPVIVLSIAMFVAFIVISLFVPLVKLVEGLS